MKRIHRIGEPVTGHDLKNRLGQQADTILKLSAAGVACLPGLLIGIEDLGADFDAVCELISGYGVSWIEERIGYESAGGKTPLRLEISLLPDVALDTDSKQRLTAAAPGQLLQAVTKLFIAYSGDPLNLSLPAALMIRYLPETDGKSAAERGTFLNRDPDSGVRQSRTGLRRKLSRKQLTFLERSADRVERQLLDIRQLDFIIDGDRTWIAGQSRVDRTPEARLKLLSEFHAKGELASDDFIRSVSPTELNSLFQSVVDPKSASGLARIEGGLAGSFGAGCGRVYFSAAKLLQAYRSAEPDGQAGDFILLRTATHAEDLEAIGISRGVITGSGGYTSHAPIVARHLGIPAIIHPDMEFQTGRVTIRDREIREGQYLTIDVPSNCAPTLYIGKARIRDSSRDNQDLSTLLELANRKCVKPRIRANADTAAEAYLALKYGADGIGLCRTEHMLRDSESLRDMQLQLNNRNSSPPESLTRLESFFETGFLELFRILDGKPLTIRLLDAPLHEFNPKATGLLNPMLGLRGCRLGISMPQLYEAQVKAVLNAALKADHEGLTVQPDILVPFVMSGREMQLLRHGYFMDGQKIRGIDHIIRDTVRAAGLIRLPFRLKIGAVIELPAAAISANRLVHQAEVISFGTNDLTQTTLGISRDDTGSLLQLYEELDIWEGDPFKDLVEPVRKLVETAVASARAVRPDIEIGICGEAGISRDTIRFATRLGLDYISCSPRAIPAALLTAAQLQLEEN